MGSRAALAFLLLCVLYLVAGAAAWPYSLSMFIHPCWVGWWVALAHCWCSGSVLIMSVVAWVGWRCLGCCVVPVRTEGLVPVVVEHWVLVEVPAHLHCEGVLCLGYL